MSEQHYLNVGGADSLDERVHHFASYLDLSWSYQFHNLNESFPSLWIISVFNTILSLNYPVHCNCLSM